MIDHNRNQQGSGRKGLATALPAFKEEEREKDGRLATSLAGQNAKGQTLFSVGSWYIPGLSHPIQQQRGLLRGSTNEKIIRVCQNLLTW